MCAKLIVVDFHGTILLGFVMIGAADVKEGLAASQLTTLIRTDETAVRKTVCFKEFIDDVQQWRFTVTMFSSGDLL